MKNLFILLFVFLLYSCENNIHFDTEENIDFIYDINNNQYKIVTIGNQSWMAENLRTTHYSNGDSLIYFENHNDWIENKDPYYIILDHDITNIDKYGIMYNFYTIDTCSICPDGWKMPSKNDWLELIEYCGGEDVAGGVLKDTSLLYWDQVNNISTDFYGFKALPNEAFNAYFHDDNLYGNWWSTEVMSNNDNFVESLYFVSDKSKADFKALHKNFGAYIRCLKE